jgi:MFS family permease
VSVSRAPVWTIYALVLTIGVVSAFNAPSVSSLLPLLVDKESFNEANAWASGGFQLASMAGPALAGWLIAQTGSPAYVYATTAGCSLLFSLTLMTLPKPRHVPPAKVKEPLWAGVRFVFSSQVLLAAITLDLFAVLLGGATALLPIFAKDILRVGPSGLGWMRAAPAIGALAVALVTTRSPPWRRPGRVLLVVVAGFGLATIGFALSRSYALSLIMLGLTGVFDNVSVIIRATLEQVVTPDRLRGRVSAIHYVFIGLSNELGSFESGTAAALFGTVPSVVLGGIGTLCTVGWVLWKWPQMARLGPLSEIAATEPAPQT